MLLRIILFPLLISAFFISGCKETKIVSSSGKADEKSKDALSFAERKKLDVYFTDGIIQKMQGNYSHAIDKFSKCLDIYPDHAASLYEIAYIDNGLGRNGDALPYIQKAVSLDPSNEWYRMLLARCLMGTSRFSDAASVFETLVKYNPDKMDYYFSWASALLHGGKVKEAIEVYDKIEAKMGVTEEVIVQKERIYLLQNQVDKAISEAQKLIRTYPREIRYYRMLADLYFQNKKDDKFLEITKKIFELEPNEPYTHLMLADYHEAVSSHPKAFQHIKAAFENPDLHIDEKVKIILKYFDIPEKFKAEKQEADTLLDILLRVHSNDARSHSLQGDFLYRDGKNKEARDAFRNAIQLDNTRYPLWQQVLVLDELLGDFDSMEKESSQAMELFPAEPYNYIFNASAHYQKKNYAHAVEVLKNGKDYVAGDKKLLAQFYSLFGDCYNGMKEHKLSDESYEKSINLDPENANVMNNWAYFLSLRNENLVQAEKLSRKSNQLVKDNASYEDTYAWILYKMKNYEEAKKWLEKAMEHGGKNNGVILEHYGDVLFQLGKKEQSAEYWQKAKATGKHSDFVDKKIADKKLYE